MAIRLPAALLVIPAIAGLAACIVYPRWVPEGPDAYRDGYHDGCRSGASARWKGLGYFELKERKTYRQEPEYRRGWDEARLYCEENLVIEPYKYEPREGGRGIENGGMLGGEPAGK